MTTVKSYRKKTAFGPAPDKIYHGTDGLSAMIIQKHGFEEQPEYMRAGRTEPGYLYGTTEPGFAEVYAEHRAVQFNTREGVVLEVDVRDLPVENDPTVALDSLMGIAFRVPLPVGPERVKVHKRIPHPETR